MGVKLENRLHVFRALRRIYVLEGGHGLRKEHRLRVFENRVLRRIFVPRGMN
jgi:hypothetical protein